MNNRLMEDAARLASLEHVSPQSIAQSLAVLKATGLVLSEPDPQDGHRKLMRADPSATELVDRLLAGRSSFLARPSAPSARRRCCTTRTPPPRSTRVSRPRKATSSYARSASARSLPPISTNN
ncbi:hypothetical protein ACFY0A_42600 [Streptomyces sp. NPDC001698]|uniref:hypothetical protein n=1 Tax=unclassified Streptomyces TaxID=2593676 RepID=UPI0036A7238B